MDLSSNKYLEASAMFSSNGGAILESKNGFCKSTSTKNPFLDSISDPICKLNLKETSEFVKSFPVSNNTTQSRGFFDISAQRGSENVIKRNVEAPPTPGRPIFSFSNGNFSRKNFPSKWDDAEKWLSSCNDSPSNNLLRSMDTSRMFTKQCSGYKPHLGEVFAEKSRVTEEKVVKSDFNSASAINGVSLSAYPEMLLKENADKYSNEDNPIQERFLFGNSIQNPTNNATIEMVKHRDIGTEMTPLGSSTTSRCPTPLTSISPVRHNTPANRSGPLALTSFDSSNTIDITQLQDCHLSKLNQFDSTWSTREEEEDDVSKSLRHFEMNSECRKSVSESRSCAWEDEVKTKRCLRYQREEAKIQAWVNLQSAKAEAESRKLEVKIQKMRSNLEEKLMKRMADVHRKAEEWRASAQFEHSEQIRKVGQQARKSMNRNKSHCSGFKSCGCFPCNNHQI